MGKKKYTIEELTEWIRGLIPLISPSVIAEKIGLDAGTMSKAINNKPDVRGAPVKIPERCLPALIQLYKKVTQPIK